MNYLLLTFIGMACGLGIYAINVLSREITSLRAQIKRDDQRYEQLYAEYVRECSSNPNRPRVTTVTQEQRNMPITMPQGNYLRYEAQEAQLRAVISGSVPQQQPPQSEQKI